MVKDSKGIRAALRTMSIGAEHPILGPLRFTMRLMRAGGTSIIMEKSDAEEAFSTPSFRGIPMASC